MDYGQTKQTTDSQGFFTAGVGDNPAIQNTYEGENNLDLTNDATSWSPERDLQKVGNLTNEVTKNSTPLPEPELTPTPTPELSPDTVETKENPGNSKEALQEVIESVVSPNDEPVSTTDKTQPLAFDPNLVRAEGEHISKKTLQEAERVVSAFNKDGDAASFNDAIREMAKYHVDSIRGGKVA